MILLQNGTLILPESGNYKKADILVDRDKILAIEPAIDIFDCSRYAGEGADSEVDIIDASGMMIAPGLIDTHVHFRDPGFTQKEDIRSGARAAARGGFTSVVLMANTNPHVDNLSTLHYVLEEGRKTGIHVYTCANVTRNMEGRELTDMEELFHEGALGFTDDGVPLMDEELVKRAMEQVKMLDCPISFHEENPEYIKENGINGGGKAAAFYGLTGSDRNAEISMINRDVKLAIQTGAKVVIQHISTKEGVRLVKLSKDRGALVYAEATPHHFTLTEDAVLYKGTLAKMNPPLRTEEDRLAIIKGLQDGTIDVIATDHAPHTEAEKKKKFELAPSGITGLETALSLGIRELVDKNYLTLPKLIYRMSTMPARIYGMGGGQMKVGAVSDLVVFSMTETWEAGNYFSKASNTPFTGERLPGVIHYTIASGKIVYDSEDAEER